LPRPSAARRPQGVADRLRTAILEGRLKPGTHLRQAELADRFPDRRRAHFQLVAHELEVSTKPVREAIGQLAHEGLVDLDDFRGARVHVLSGEELDQVYQARLHLLPLAVSASLARATPESLDAAADLLRRMEPVTRTSEWVLLNREFHKVLDECAGRNLYSQIMVRLADMAMLYVGSLFDHSADWTQEKAEHAQILAAYVDRDEATAIDLLTRHYGKTWKNVAENIAAKSAATSDDPARVSAPGVRTGNAIGKEKGQ
jgi:DNA-binding GntR family transcriptional regulator